MRELSEIEIIKALPLDPDMRKRLMDEYESYDENKKYEVMRACTTAFNQMKKILRSYWEARIDEEILSGERKADQEINILVEDALWKDISERISGKIQEEDELTEIRAQLEKFIESKS